MSRIDEFPGTEGACSFCGRTAVAFWSGPEIVRVCPLCAGSALPALEADALSYRLRLVPRADHRQTLLDRAIASRSGRFWQCLSRALLGGEPEPAP